MTLVVEYHEELEIDLLPDVDLLDLWRGSLSFRRVELLIRYLDPATSLTVRAANPDVAQMSSWNVTNYQLADLFDAFRGVHYKNPPPYPRPAAVIRERSRTEIRRAALIERFKAKYGKGVPAGG